MTKTTTQLSPFRFSPKSQILLPVCMYQRTGHVAQKWNAPGGVDRFPKSWLTHLQRYTKCGRARSVRFSILILAAETGFLEIFFCDRAASRVGSGRSTTTKKLRTLAPHVDSDDVGILSDNLFWKIFRAARPPPRGPSNLFIFIISFIGTNSSRQPTTTTTIRFELLEDIWRWTREELTTTMLSSSCPSKIPGYRTCVGMPCISKPRNKPFRGGHWNSSMA